MIPGLPPLPSQLGHASLLPLLHQAWFSKAGGLPGGPAGFQPPVSAASLFSPATTLAGYTFQNPFLHSLPPLQSGSPEPAATGGGRSEAAAAAEDLSLHSSAKRLRAGEASCPICNVGLPWDRLAQHYAEEVRCLDNIRPLSPAVLPPPPAAARRSASPASSPSPFKPSSVSPTSPGRLEDRWARFQRIKTKRRDRIGARLNTSGFAAASPPRRHHHPLLLRQQEEAEEEEEVDIGDRFSDCESTDKQSSSAAAEAAAPDQQCHYTEADVLRRINEEDHPVDDKEGPPRSPPGGGGGGGPQCPVCRAGMGQAVLNVNCWHIKCERCWLKAVGTDCVCGLCSAPATVKELRKVHM